MDVVAAVWRTALVGLMATISLTAGGVGIGRADSSELEYRGADLATPTNEAVLPSSAGNTFTWSLPPGVSASDLAITEDPSFFSGFTGSGTPTRPGVFVAPLEPQQTTSLLPSSLPRGVTLYWAVSSVCSECSFGPTPIIRSPLRLGLPTRRAGIRHRATSGE